jgi:hypothetical protein
MRQLGMLSLLKNGNNLMGFPMTMHGSRSFSQGAGVDISKLFAATPYTATGSAQTITNGIDFAGRGGRVWEAGRNLASGGIITDTLRGSGSLLRPSSTSAETTLAGYPLFLSNGYSIPAGTWANGNTVASWSFAQDPRFFRAVPVTADASGGATFDTGLAVGATLSIGQLEFKSRSTGAWPVYHRALGVSQQLFLNTTAAAVTNANWISISGSVATVAAGKLTANATYIVYASAHDTASDGVIQCGNLSTDASGNATVSLGWAPQFLLAKSSSAIGSWVMADSARGFTAGSQKYLSPNTTDAETSFTNATEGFTPTGFTEANTIFGPSRTGIYLAIRAVGG